MSARFDWDAVCENGWAAVLNRDYVHGMRLNKLSRWAFSDKPWIVVYVQPGNRWRQRQHQRFHTHAEALAFIRGES